MATFEVTTDLLIHTRVLVTVEADDKDAAIDAASSVLPNNFDLHRTSAWKAKIDLKPPKGIECRFLKTTHFEQASGADRARKIG